MFKKIHYRDDKNLLDFDNGKIILRNAVRAVIIDKNMILMAHLEKTDEYKFPGGGIEEDETTEEALKREVLEEAGYSVKAIGEKIGTITEYMIAEEGNGTILKMISEYYAVTVDNKPLNQRLDEYEAELMFKPRWVEIEKAYNTNKTRIENKNKATSGIERETIVLEILKEKLRLG